MVNQYTNSIVPNEKSLGFLYPEHAKQWSTNNPVSPDLVYANSGKKYLWICPFGHEWLLPINHKVQGGNCRICSGLFLAIGINDLKTRRPELALEFDEKSNGIKAEEAFSIASKRYYWKCSLGHVWKDSISHRVHDETHCPICSGRTVLKGFNDLESCFPKIANEWNYSKNLLKPFEVTSKSGIYVWWICEKGHEWETRIAARTQGRGCKDCSHHGVSEQERILYTRFVEEGFSVLKNKFLEATVSYTNRKKIEYDLVFPENKVVIEYDGNFWHSKEDSLVRDLERTQSLIAKNWKVMRIRDSNLMSLNFSNKNYAEIFIKGHQIYNDLDYIVEVFNEFIQAN